MDRGCDAIRTMPEAVQSGVNFPPCRDRWRAFFATEGGEGASASGDAGLRREVPFVAFPQLGKFLEGGEFLQILEPKLDQKSAGGFVEEGVSGIVLVTGRGR